MTKYKSTIIEGREYALVPVDELFDLLQSSEWLSIVEAAGVDNWDGLEVAHDIADNDGYHELFEDENLLYAKYIERPV